jgi:hypothetical protein
MNDKERRRLDKYEREMAFMIDNAADFPAQSPGAVVAVMFQTEVQRARDCAANQVSGADMRAMKIDEKEEKLADLKEMMTMLDRAGDALGDEIEGIENLFGLPRNRSEQSVLAAARAQHAASEAYETQLVGYNLPADFRLQMHNLINGVDAANQAADISGESSAGATNAFKDCLRKLGAMSKKLDALNRNKYRNDPQKLGAWLVASHLARAPQTNPAGNNANQPS